MTFMSTALMRGGCSSSRRINQGLFAYLSGWVSASKMAFGGPVIAHTVADLDHELRLAGRHMRLRRWPSAALPAAKAVASRPRM